MYFDRCGNIIDGFVKRHKKTIYKKESVMKTRKKISAKGCWRSCLFFAFLLPLAWNVPVEAAEAKQIDVLFSHDTHSHLNSFSTIVDGEQKRGWRICKDQNPDR